MRIALLFCFFLAGLLGAQAQTQWLYTKYWVQFTDKAGTPYSVYQPQEYLSDKAIERRNRYGIDIDSTDLPVKQAYIDSVLRTGSGARLLNKSKWFNSISISVSDSETVAAIQALPFVKHMEPVAALRWEKTDDSGDVVYSLERSQNYGYSFNQISMVQGDYLHELGFRGEGMIIAVLDAGFSGVNQIPAFDSLRESGRLLGTYDFVRGQENVFDIGTHGRNVFSIMAGYLPGVYVGSAPMASYYLFRTEDGSTEFRIEEDNWVAAAELADSLGVDLINSSLGYSNFSDTSMSYTYADMDGNTALVTRGADLAARKGMLVVCSAGNEGNGTWHYVTSPADGDSVLTIGAVNPDAFHTSFSSYGPTADGRIKPDVCGQGASTAYVGDGGNIYTGNGTSYSSPLIAGLVACLWQSNRDLSNIEIMDLVRETASSYANPTDSMGYGLAMFRNAHFKVLQEMGPLYVEENLPVVYPNPFSDKLNVMIMAETPGVYHVEVYDSYGSRLYVEERYITVKRYSNFDLSMLSTYPNGMYVVRIRHGEEIQNVKVIKL